MRALHLDNEYRDRYQEFYLADGRVFDSRNTNWRQVDWEKVIKIVVNLRGIKHEFVLDPDSQGMMTFRWGGSEALHDKDGKFVGRKNIHLWTIGMIKGDKCHLTDLDFHMGNIVKKYVAPLSEFKAHVHPRLNLVA